MTTADGIGISRTEMATGAERAGITETADMASGYAHRKLAEACASKNLSLLTISIPTFGQNAWRVTIACDATGGHITERSKFLTMALNIAYERLIAARWDR